MNCREGKHPIGPSPYVTHAKIPLYIPRKSYGMKIWKTNLITHNNHTSLHRWWFEWLYCRKGKSNIFTEASNNLSWTQSTSTQHWDCWFAERSTTQSLMFAQSEGKHGTIERCTSFAGSNSRLKTTGIKNFKMSGSATLFVTSSSLAPSIGFCGCSNKSNSLRLWKELQRPESSRADEFECNPLNGVRWSDTAPQISFLHVASTSCQKSLPTRLLGTWCMLIATIIL